MRNEYEIRDEVTAIFICSRKYGKFETLIDTVDLEKVKSFPNSWRIRYYKELDRFYVLGNITMNEKIKTTSLHRWLMNDPVGLEVDHINTNSLDNRRSTNLRVATKSQNAQNRKGAQSNNGSSGIRGVTWSKAANKWMVQVVVEGEKYYGGLFNDINDAENQATQLRKEYMPYSKEALKGGEMIES